MSDEYDTTDRSLEDLLLSYQSYKGKHTRSSGKVLSLLTLIHQSFSKHTAKTLFQELTKTERYVDILSTISDWMVANQADKAKEHFDEVAVFAADLARCNDNYQKIMHAQTQSNPADTSIDEDYLFFVKPSSARPVTELKPKELAYDATASGLRDWKVKFQAYHTASNMRSVPIATQQAFLINTIASDISKRVTRLATDTTPIFPSDGMISCYDIIDGFFHEKSQSCIEGRRSLPTRSKRARTLRN